MCVQDKNHPSSLSNVKKGQSPVVFNLHSELDVLVNAVDVCEKNVEWSHEESVVHVTEPYGRLQRYNCMTFCY